MKKKGKRAKKLAKLPPGSLVCADANVLAYHFTQLQPLASACTAFLGQTEKVTQQGTTTTSPHPLPLSALVRGGV